MESRWIYREVERLISKDLPDGTFIHTEITKNLRRSVAETRDLLKLLTASCIARTAWAAGSPRSDSARSDANRSSENMFNAIPYFASGSRRISRRPAPRRTKSGEELMWEYIRKRDAKKKAQQAAETTKA